MTLYKWGKFERNKIYSKGKRTGSAYYFVRKKPSLGSEYRYHIVDKGVNRPLVDLDTKYPDGYLEVTWISHSTTNRANSGLSGYGEEFYTIECDLYGLVENYHKGTRIDTVTSTSRSAYPNNGESGSYWYV